MRKHVKPAAPLATIPDPVRGVPLPPEGRVVAWSPYWAGLAMRGDIEAADAADEAVPVASDEPGAAGAAVEAAVPEASLAAVEEDGAA